MSHFEDMRDKEARLRAATASTEPTIEDLGKLIRRAVKVGANIRFMNNEIDSLALTLKLSDQKTACETFYDVLKAEVERRESGGLEV